MESGAIPPPKRAPRSLVSAPKVLPKEHYMSPPLGGTSTFGGPPAFQGQYVHGSGISSDSDDQRRQNVALANAQRRIDQMAHHQTSLEEDLVSKTALVESLTAELKQMKQKKQGVDSEFAQSTADFMNSQARWLQQVDALNDEIQALKSKLGQAQRTLETQHGELAALHEREVDRQNEKHRREMKANRPDNVERNADKLEIHQNKIMLTEMKNLHTKLKHELAEQKSLNEQLTQSNEEYKDTIDQYQFLLIERTVEGNLNSGGQADEELLDGEELFGNIELQYEKDVENFSNKAEAKNDVGETEAESSNTGNEEVVERNSSSANASLSNELARKQFEVTSLQNHNRALKVSLESLVARLLENQSFTRIVEESVAPNMVDSFKTRMMNCSRPRLGSTGPSSTQAASMIFNQHYTGNPNRRVFSLGVDNEVKGPAPLDETSGSGASQHDFSVQPQHSSITAQGHKIDDQISPAGRRSSSLMAGFHQRSHSPSTSSSSSTIPGTAMPGQGLTTSINLGSIVNTRRSLSGTSANMPDGVISVARRPRVESLTEMRKLRMRE